jgi:hypothetical protein
MRNYISLQIVYLAIKFRNSRDSPPLPRYTQVMKRRLPIGIQDFVSIREGGFCYVDKKQHGYSLTNV